MSLLLAQQQDFNPQALAMLALKTVAMSSEQAAGFVEARERQRKLNLDQQTQEAKMRLDAQTNAANRQYRARQLALDEATEQRLQLESDAELADLNRKAAAYKSVQQFRSSAGENGYINPDAGFSGRTHALPGAGEVPDDEYLPETPGEVLPPIPDDPNAPPPPPGQAPQVPPPANDQKQALGERINELARREAAAWQAGDETQARAIGSQISNLNRIYFSPAGSTTDPTILAGRQANAAVAIETQDEKIAKAQADAEAAQIRVQQLQTGKPQENSKATPSQKAVIQEKIGEHQSALARDTANRATRERVLKPLTEKVREDLRPMVEASLEESGTIPKVMSPEERKILEKRIEGLQATLADDSTTGSRESAGDFLAPPQDRSDGQDKSLRSIIGGQ